MLIKNSLFLAGEVFIGNQSLSEMKQSKEQMDCTSINLLDKK